MPGISSNKFVARITDKVDSVKPYVKKAIHWGFIPAIIVVGMTCTEPKPSLAQVLGPM